MTGNHEDGNGNDDVFGLFWSMHDVTIETIPSGIGAVFANLKAVAFQFGIESVSADDLMQFPHLEELHLERNQIATLDGNLLTHTPNIRWMEFDQNELQVIGNELIDGLDQLEMARFRFNLCIDFAASSQVEFQKLRSRFEICSI